jgi:hypothetical protein
MNDDTGSRTVIDFFWEWYRRHDQAGRKPMAELALDKCEETLQQREWESFGRWFAIYRRERARAAIRSDRR